MLSDEMDCPDVNAIRTRTTLPVALLIFSYPESLYNHHLMVFGRIKSELLNAQP